MPLLHIPISAPHLGHLLHQSRPADPLHMSQLLAAQSQVNLVHPTAPRTPTYRQHKQQHQGNISVSWCTIHHGWTLHAKCLPAQCSAGAIPAADSMMSWCTTRSMHKVMALRKEPRQGARLRQLPPWQCHAKPVPNTCCSASVVREHNACAAN